MELRQLQHFVAVAEDQHFTRAAERLMVSQSGLSASIRSLERELRAPLFVRTTRSVTLTPAGRALLGEAERILAQVRTAHEAVAAVQGVLRGMLALGSEQCIAGVHVAGLLAAFRRRHPDVEICLRQAGSGALAEEVAAGRLDLAFAVRAAREDTEQLRAVPLTSEPMTVLCHPSHRLAGAAAAVTLEELGGEVFVDFHPDWGPRRTTDAAFAAAGVRRTVALEVNDVHGLLDLVDEDLGIAVVPRHFRHKRESLTALEVKGTGERVYETVALLPSPQATSPAARALMELLEGEGARGPALRDGGAMHAKDILIDGFNRIQEEVHATVEGLGPDDLHARPEPDANSIGWLVWHLTRVQDDHIADAFELDQVWLAQDFQKTFGLDLPRHDTGYGHTATKVDKVRVDSGDLLTGYYDAVHAQTLGALRELAAKDLERVVDERWDPPVTLGVRLVSVLSDDLQHIGQAAYVRGLLQSA